MKKRVLLTAISFLTMLAPLPDIGSAVPEGTGALPDIWVYRGHYAYFSGDRASLEASDLEELRSEFISGTSSFRDADRVNRERPFSGRLGACDVFVLDDTELYFKDAELPSGGLYGFCDVNLISGNLSASAVSAAGGLYIAAKAELMVGNDVNVGGTLECFGGSIAAGGINAGGIWLDSAEAPLSVTVAGNVFTGFYTQCGGRVEIGGGLYCQDPGGLYAGALLTVSSEYAVWSATYLHVYGDVLSLGRYGGIEIGGGSGVGGHDEASFRAQEVRRSDKKSGRRDAYDASVPASDVTLIIGGELRSLGSVVFYEGIDT